MLTKQEFIENFKNEVTTGENVFKAFGSESLEYQPHDKSKSVLELLKSLCGEIICTADMAEGKVLGEKEWMEVNKAIPNFESGEQAAEFISKAKTDLLTRLEVVPEENLKEKYNFFGMDSTIEKALYFMLCDFIHHRGQLTVYIRLTGGQIPSIYGPTADSE